MITLMVRGTRYNTKKINCTSLKVELRILVNHFMKMREIEHLDNVYCLYYYMLFFSIIVHVGDSMIRMIDSLFLSLQVERTSEHHHE